MKLAIVSSILLLSVSSIYAGKDANGLGKVGGPPKQQGLGVVGGPHKQQQGLGMKTQIN